MVIKVIVGWLLVDVVFVIVWCRIMGAIKDPCEGCIYNDCRVKMQLDRETCQVSGCFKTGKGFED